MLFRSGHALVYPDGSRSERNPHEEKYYTNNEQILVDYLNDKITPFTWDKLYRTDICKGYHYPEGIQRGEDGIGSLSTLTQVNKLVVIPDSIGLYFMNPEGLTWGSLPPVTNTEDHIGRLEKILGDRLKNPKIAEAFVVAQGMVILLNAQQALLIGGDHSGDSKYVVL